MSRDEMRDVAQEAVRQFLATIGIDATSVQDLRGLEEDLNWVRRYRRLSERIGSTILLTGITLITGGLLTALWTALQHKLAGRN